MKPEVIAGSASAIETLNNLNRYLPHISFDITFLASFEAKELSFEFRLPDIDDPVALLVAESGYNPQQFILQVYDDLNRLVEEICVFVKFTDKIPLQAEVDCLSHYNQSNSTRPNLPSLVGAIDIDNTHAVITETIRNAIPLKHYMFESDDEVEAVLNDVLEQYVLLHGIGIIHDDPHSGNIMIIDPDSIAIIDFGTGEVDPDDMEELVKFEIDRLAHFMHQRVEELGLLQGVSVQDFVDDVWDMYIQIQKELLPI